MSSVCKQHKFHPSHQLLSLKKSLRDIDIPPRKLLTRRAPAIYDGATDMFSDEILFQKYLPHNNMNMVDDSDVDYSDPYSSDHFRIPRQLRVLPANSHSGTFSCSTNKKSKFLNPGSSIKHSSLFLHCNSSSASICSPTSTTLFGMSHFSSPPMSPSSCSSASPANGLSPMSRFLGSEKKHDHGVGVMSYKDMLNELMFSLEDMNFNEANSNYNSPNSCDSSKKNLNLFDASFNCEDQQHFVLSPSSATSLGFGRFDDDINAPDLGWVNDLLM
ncbi:hypothetical protein TanjilG_11692 [Lupinus angustifolius]|uniref:Uncharacterized protein n=1 Tax=Lupinus angustifolius TaxID=3871 RepID=A0A1J7HW54_LUPAN|nr:hypothetical protein TanjilG_11692 [Lupinus angustifolius]